MTGVSTKHLLTALKNENPSFDRVVYYKTEMDKVKASRWLKKLTVNL